MWEKVLHPFAVAIAWVWVKIHDLLVLVGMPAGSGVAWVLSIVLLTIVVRLLIIPLFLRQVRSSRGMQAVQPEMLKIQAKYKGKTDTVSRQKMAEETQALYKKYGTSPFASCLPLLVQMPVLFALYRAIFAIKPLVEGTYTIGGTPYSALGPIDQAMAKQIDDSTVLGVRLSHTIGSGDGTLGLIAFIVMIVVMVVLQFLSIRMSMTKNMPPQSDPNNPMVRSQKMMMYMMPAMFIFSGLFFQMGLLVYMVTTTLWSWGQQLWTIKVMPTPGSPAYFELVGKREEKYKEWAKPFFADYDSERAQLASNEDAVADLDSRTLEAVQKMAKPQRVASDFPESMGEADRVAIYRNLASQEWTTLPDEQWMRGVKRATEKANDRKAQASTREQPRRMTKEQRRRAAEREAEEQREAEERSQRRARQQSGPSLTPEEIERRRQQRQSERRQQARKKKGK